MASRVIVCKVGRLGELVKLVDCPLSELRPEESPPHPSRPSSRAWGASLLNHQAFLNTNFEDSLVDMQGDMETVSKQIHPELSVNLGEPSSPTKGGPGPTAPSRGLKRPAERPSELQRLLAVTPEKQKPTKSFINTSMENSLAYTTSVVVTDPQQLHVQDEICLRSIQPSMEISDSASLSKGLQLDTGTNIKLGQALNVDPRKNKIRCLLDCPKLLDEQKALDLLRSYWAEDRQGAGKSLIRLHLFPDPLLTLTLNSERDFPLQSLPPPSEVVLVWK